jgi:hypothetical protein
MSSVRRGDKTRPSRVAYHKEGRRSINKVFRIKRYNGMDYLLSWGRKYGVDVLGLIETNERKRRT